MSDNNNKVTMVELENPVSGAKHITTMEIGLKIQMLGGLIKSNGDEDEISELWEEIASEDPGAVKLMMDHRNRPQLP